jgi:hypothetical protein
MIPDTFTQRGAPEVDPRLGSTPVSPPLSE